MRRPLPAGPRPGQGLTSQLCPQSPPDARLKQTGVRYWSSLPRSQPINPKQQGPTSSSPTSSQGKTGSDTLPSRVPSARPCPPGQGSRCQTPGVGSRSPASAHGSKTRPWKPLAPHPSPLPSRSLSHQQRPRTQPRWGCRRGQARLTALGTRPVPAPLPSPTAVGLGAEKTLQACPSGEGRGGGLCPHTDLLGAGWLQRGAQWPPLCARTQPLGRLQYYLQIKTTQAITERRPCGHLGRGRGEAQTGSPASRGQRLRGWALLTRPAWALARLSVRTETLALSILGAWQPLRTGESSPGTALHTESCREDGCRGLEIPPPPPRHQHVPAAGTPAPSSWF